MVNKKDYLKGIVKEGLDKELDYIEFSHKARNNVLRVASKRERIISRILNYELVIPLKPLVATMAALVIVVGYVSYPVLKVDKNDILLSKVAVVKLEARR